MYTVMYMYTPFRYVYGYVYIKVLKTIYIYTSCIQTI